MKDKEALTDELAVATAEAIEAHRSDDVQALLVENTSDHALPFGNAPGEVKGPDPTEHLGNDG